MRSTAGILAGLFLAALIANCGGSDSNSNGGNSGTANAGEGGQGVTTLGGAPTTGGSATDAGATNVAGQGGMPAPSGCTKDEDCGANATCVDKVCKSADGEACTSADDCLNTCIDNVCTSKLDDGQDCMSDADCAHTCIDNVCAPVSDVGGDCDVDLGAGGAGAGGAGAGGASAGGATSGEAGAGGANSSMSPQAHDCKAPLECYAGKCLTPDGEACKDNVDCVNTCIDSVCQPRSQLKEKCDENSDCVSDALVCDNGTSTCKLDLTQLCTDNAQCQSNRCICADDHCTTRACKTADSVCQCRWSQPDAETCNNASAPVKFGAPDPNGCASGSNNTCSGDGQCIPNQAGDCAQKCKYLGPGDDGKANTSDDLCGEFGAPTGCNAGYHGAETPNGNCRPVMTKVYKADGVTFDHYDYPCQAACTCDPNN